MIVYIEPTAIRLSLFRSHQRPKNRLCFLSQKGYVDTGTDGILHQARNLTLASRRKHNRTRPVYVILALQDP
ncbi:hypothetical protein EYR41_000018 [Orbilia oligospora]|uniref:Uncharacterized protein n=1 Tax=Orbilia oligospora TaxID=2813651 RepID=A0A7C8KLC2_ORBOL|nr:hypothetical protein TWF751_006498 [Orbilia oligospora]TGJ72890.1 hypothetical protein EYR41_000018 [Orbilia oligospora]